MVLNILAKAERKLHRVYANDMARRETTIELGVGMSWYYHDGTNQVGPFADPQVVELIKSGTIKQDTPVWKEGLPEWCLASSTEFTQHFLQANWYYHDGTNQVGPFADSQVVELVKNGTIKRDTKIWKEGLPDWCLASTTEFAQHFAKMPPPITPTPRLAKTSPPKAPPPTRSEKLKKAMSMEDDEVPDLSDEEMPDMEDEEMSSMEDDEMGEMNTDSAKEPKIMVMPRRFVGWMLLGIGIVGLIPGISIIVAIGCILMGLFYILGAKRSMAVLKNIARHAQEGAAKQKTTRVS